MKQSLLCFVMLFLITVTQTYSKQRCGNHPCVPNLNLINQGIDMVTGEFKLPPFATKKGKNKIKTPSGNTWGYYDQHKVTIGEQSNTKEIYSNSKSITEYLQKLTRVNVDKGAWLSLSNEVKRVRSITKDKILQYSRVHANFGVFKFELIPNQLLKPSYNFLDQLNNLPDEYDEAKYIEAIKKFGTHFMTEVTLGGRLETEVRVRDSYVKLVGAGETLYQAVLEFQFFLTNEFQRRNERKDPGADVYNQNSQTITKMEGGRRGFRFTDYKKWEKTVEFGPVIIDYKVKRISEMIGRHKKKENYLRATMNEEVYLTYLGFYIISIYRLAHEFYHHGTSKYDVRSEKLELIFILERPLVVHFSLIIHVKIYQGVTLSAVHRHPTIEDDVPPNSFVFENEVYQ
eukprot:gene11224-4046_t